MQFKLSRETAVEWIESTVKEIERLLRQRQIPYENSWTRDDSMYGVYHTHQLKFPWHEGDVVVGTLHASDDDVINGLAPLGYPSIETYKFPWDEGDITVFNSPEEFVFQLYDFYVKTVLAEKTNS